LVLAKKNGQAIIQTAILFDHYHATIVVSLLLQNFRCITVAQGTLPLATTACHPAACSSLAADAACSLLVPMEKETYDLYKQLTQFVHVYQIMHSNINSIGRLV